MKIAIVIIAIYLLVVINYLPDLPSGGIEIHYKSPGKEWRTQRVNFGFIGWSANEFIQSLNSDK